MAAKKAKAKPKAKAKAAPRKARRAAKAKPAPSVPASVAKKAAIEPGQRVTFCKPEGSIHGGAVKEAHDDGTCHIAVDDGTEVKVARRTNGTDPKPGEFVLA